VNEELKKLIAKIEEMRKTSERVGAENQKVLDALKADIDKLKGTNPDAQTLSELQDRIENIEAKRGQPGKTGVGRQTETTGPKFYDAKTGKLIQTLGHKDKMSDLDEHRNRSGVSLGQWLHATILGERAPDDVRQAVKALATAPDGAGGYTVPKPLAGSFIDLLRAELVLSRAGVTTVPMESKTLTIAKVVSDPYVSWKAENAAINGNDPTFDAVELEAKTLVGLVKFSLELAQDSSNIQSILERCVTQAAAHAIDHAGLLGTVAEGGPLGVMTYAGRQQITSVGSFSSYDPFVDAVGKLLAVNVPLDRAAGAAIMGTDVWTSLAKLKTGITGDKTPLVRPSAIQNMQFLPTTAVPTSGGSPQDGNLFVADWGDLLFGVRKDITVQVLREAFLGSNLQLAILVYARCDFMPVRESSFVTLEDVAA